MPEGAIGLLRARTSKGPWYVVFGTDGSLQKRERCPDISWFPFPTTDNRQSWCFLNYFHALAYSLKRKAANDPDPS
jgi:hypothetical protein